MLPFKISILCLLTKSFDQDTVERLEVSRFSSCRINVAPVVIGCFHVFGRFNFGLPSVGPLAVAGRDSEQEPREEKNRLLHRLRITVAHC